MTIVKIRAAREGAKGGRRPLWPVRGRIYGLRDRCSAFYLSRPLFHLERRVQRGLLPSSGQRARVTWIFDSSVSPFVVAPYDRRIIRRKPNRFVSGYMPFPFSLQRLHYRIAANRRGVSISQCPSIERQKIDDDDKWSWKKKKEQKENKRKEKSRTAKFPEFERNEGKEKRSERKNNGSWDQRFASCNKTNVTKYIAF